MIAGTYSALRIRVSAAPEGPWCAALDFPFGLPRTLLTNLGWPERWEDVIALVATLGKAQFEETITRYCAGRPAGDKHHLRAADVLAKARSPMMLHRVPVGKMFFQGAPRLLASGANILPCRPNSDSRTVLEGYPALVARRWIGSRSYKSDERSKQTEEKLTARREIVQVCAHHALFERYGIQLALDETLAERLIRNQWATVWMPFYVLSRRPGPTTNATTVMVSHLFAIAAKAGLSTPRCEGYQALC